MPVKITPLSAVGAEVTEVDVRALTDTQDAQLKAAFAQHGLLIFRGQDLTETDHVALAERWGQINTNRFFKAHADYHKSHWLKKCRIKFRTSVVTGIPTTLMIRFQRLGRSWSHERCRKLAGIPGLQACTALLISYRMD